MILLYQSVCIVVCVSPPYAPPPLHPPFPLQEQPESTDKVKEKLQELDERWSEVEEANEVHSEWLEKCGELAEFKRNYNDLVDRLDNLHGEVSNYSGCLTDSLTH